MATDKKRVRVKATSTNQGGRPRKDLIDPFTNELLVRVPTPKDGSLINENAKLYWSETCKLLIARKQLKQNHLPIVLSLCNAFAVTSFCSGKTCSAKNIQRYYVKVHGNFTIRPEK